MAIFTLAWVAVYLPVETYFSFAGTGLFRFAYLVDLVGMGFLMAGAATAWRGHAFAGALLATGWSWTAANFWRGTMDRYGSALRGWAIPGNLRLDLWLGPVATMVAILAIGVSLWLAYRAVEEQD